MFRKFRIAILLVTLLSVGLTAWRANSRLTAWEHTIHVAIYPIAADTRPATTDYVRNLSADHFDDIAPWMQEQCDAYGKTILQPLAIHLAPPIADRPPPMPVQPGALDAMLWSLKLRWWAAQQDAPPGPKPHVRLFVLYHDPAEQPRLPHSTGLAKGQVGVIHAFAHRKQRRQNNIVITHELLHTFGASDKYDLQTGLPNAPHGYAEPTRTPLLPQEFAEIMAGRTPISPEQAEIPPSLAMTLIGPETAREIGLLRSTGKTGKK